MAADDLARRLVAAPGFRWMPGMVLSNGYRLGEADMADARAGDTWGWLPAIWSDAPATEGCLLRLARDAWDSEVDVEGYGTHSVCVVVGYDTESRGFRGATLGEALAHAILAAPGVDDA